MLYALGSRKVQLIGSGHYVAPNATIIGDVVLESESSIWFNVVIRGDNDTITIGARSNIQDGSVLHTDAGVPLTLGPSVSVGHLVMLHGCTIGDGSLIGIKAVILNGARIGRDCLIGANTLIAEGKEIPPRSMVLGSPGKIIRQLSDEDVKRFGGAAGRYVKNWKRFAAGMKPQA